MRTLVCSLLLALALLGCGSSASTTPAATTPASTEATAQRDDPATSGTESPPVAQITVDEVATALEAADGRIAVYDANSRDTYAQGHVPSAVWVDYDAVTAEQLPEDRSTRLVFYCANEQCSAAPTAAETAQALGYENVAVMGAGIQGWIAAGKPTETAPPPAE